MSGNEGATETVVEDVKETSMTGLSKDQDSSVKAQQAAIIMEDATTVVSQLNGGGNGVIKTAEEMEESLGDIKNQDSKSSFTDSKTTVEETPMDSSPNGNMDLPNQELSSLNSAPKRETTGDDIQLDNVDDEPGPGEGSSMLQSDSSDDEEMEANDNEGNGDDEQTTPHSSSKNSQETTNANKEDKDDDCQIIASPSSSKPFRLKQTRVHTWVQSPDHLKDNPSFKYDLPSWVDKFKDYFDFVKNAPPSKSKKINPIYIFQCRHCVGQKRANGLRVRGKGSFIRHLKKVHQTQYKKFINENPGFVVKKLKLKVEK